MISASPPPSASQSDWRDPGWRPALLHGDVHVWRAVLDDAARVDERVGSYLSSDEQQRASAFVRPRDRWRFIVRRGLLRALVAGYVGCAPDLLQLRSGLHGKPELAWPSGEPPVSFSCSHSHGLALYAITRGRRIGVDVEAIRSLPERDQVAQLCCSSRERAALRALPAELHDAALMNAWTRKEAYLKAIGVGLAQAPDRVEVSLGPGAAPALLAIDGDAEAAGRWSVRPLVPAAGYVGAVVIEGRVTHLDALDVPRRVPSTTSATTSPEVGLSSPSRP